MLRALQNTCRISALSSLTGRDLHAKHLGSALPLNFGSNIQPAVRFVASSTTKPLWPWTYTEDKAPAKPKRRTKKDALPGSETTEPHQPLPKTRIIRRRLPPPLKRQPQKELEFGSLSEEQMQVYNQVVHEGLNVFYTGSAGTGKSALTRHIVRGLQNKHGESQVFVTASTGIAACNIGGSTLHHFAGIKLGKEDVKELMRKMRSDKKKVWRQARVLVVDEISMIDAEFFDKIEAVARWVRADERPFGGLQLVLCGDFLQLPPVDGKYCFEAECWKRSIHKSIELRQVFRQTDSEFIEILNSVRRGIVPASAATVLEGCSRELPCDDGIVPTKLFPLRSEVHKDNELELAKLPGTPVTFTAQDTGDESHLRTLRGGCLAPEKLELKVGAQVMLVKNLPQWRVKTEALVNGARGVVMRFEEGLPIVRFASGIEAKIDFEEWNIVMGGEQVARRVQIPLALAWALSIHKSQGMTIERVEMSLKKVFASGQAYVALSRAVSLSGLRLLDFKPSSVRADPKVIRFYDTLEQVAPSTTPTTTAVPPANPSPSQPPSDK